MRTSPSRTDVRELTADDLDEVVRIDALHTGQETHDYWRRIFEAFLGNGDGEGTFGFGVESDRGLAGYLFGETRAVEFGSEPCGWVFAVGIEERWLRRGVATRLLGSTLERFREAGVDRIRTMVRRNDVPILSFFRAAGFVGGPYVQLELELS